MKEEDYFIRSFKPRLTSSQQLEDYFNNQNSASYNSLAGSLPNIVRKSISVIAPSGVKSKGTKKYMTNIFKGWKFYLESSQKKEV